MTMFPSAAASACGLLKDQVDVQRRHQEPANLDACCDGGRPLKALAARYQWLQGTSDSMRVQGSTDPPRAHLLLNIIVPELPPGARRHQASSYIHTRRALRTLGN